LAGFEVTGDNRLPADCFAQYLGFLFSHIFGNAVIVFNQKVRNAQPDASPCENYLNW
jgi:hypothetical protein